MVYLSLAEEMARIKGMIVNNGGLELALYQYLHGQEQTQSIDEFDFDEHKIAYKGYSKIKEDKDRLEMLLNIKQPKGIGYSANIYCFMGIHLAADEYRKDIMEKRFKESELKSKYIISVVFPNFQEELYQILKTDEMKKDLYYQIISACVHTEFSMNEIKEILQQFFTSRKTFDVIDLYMLEVMHGKNIEVGFHEHSAVETVLKILGNFSNSIKKVTSDRYNKRNGIEIKDEYDVQDMLFALLKGFFQDLEREDPVPKLAGKSSRIDLNIRSQGIMIEVKMIKEKDKDHKKFIEELKVDIINYSEWKELKHLILFTYDPYKKTTDDNHFKELEGNNERNGIKFYVYSVLVK